MSRAVEPSATWLRPGVIVSGNVAPGAGPFKAGGFLHFGEKQYEPQLSIASMSPEVFRAIAEQCHLIANGIEAANAATAETAPVKAVTP